LASFTAEILDANLNVVGHVLLYGGSGSVGSISLSGTTFSPELGPLTVSGDQGAQGQWNGTGLDNRTQLPNGFYHLRLVQGGRAALDAPFWIKHQDYAGGNLVALTGGLAGGATLGLGYNYPEAVQLEVRVYNLAGELVSQGSAVGLSGVVTIYYRSAGGLPIAAGIYLIQVRGTTVNGGAEFLKLLKVAVTR
jgi:hypothetical protein